MLLKTVSYVSIAQVYCQFATHILGRFWLVSELSVLFYAFLMEMTCTRHVSELFTRGLI